MKIWAENLANLFFSFASNRPQHYGVYKQVQRDDIDELLAYYETDICEAAQYLDKEGITRLAQSLYLIKSKSFENIWWRVENRVI